MSRFSVDEEYFVLSYPLHVVRLPDTLAPAERAIARRIVDGASFREIAAERRTSARTIANQSKAIYRKLGIGSRLELAAVAHQLSRSPKE